MRAAISHRHYIFRSFLVAGVLYAACSFAQLNQPFRFEEERKNSDQGYHLISLYEEGLALVRDNEKYEDGKKMWELTILDSTLQKSWSGKIALEPRQNFIGYEYVKGNVYLLFRNGEVNSNDLNLLHFSLATHEYKSHEIKHQFDFRLTHFTVSGSNAVFGGYVVREPAVLLYSIEEKQVKVVPGFFLHDTELLDLRVNHNNTFNVLMTERGSKDEKKLIVRTYDQSGTMLLDDIITLDNEKNLLTGMTSSLMRDEMIVVGTYTVGTGKLATGFYSVMVDPFSDQAIRYTDLTQFQHLLDFMGDKRATKIKDNAQQKRKKGKTPAFKSHIALVRIKEMDKGFLLLAEVYNSSTGNTGNYPYWNNSYYGYGNGYSPYGPYNYNNRYYNSPYSFSNPVQNTDVKMIESVIILFEENGLPDWDESFGLADIKYPAIEQTSDFAEKGQEIVMAYKKESDVYSKRTKIHDGTSVTDTTKIKLPNESDVIKNESENDNGLRHWYKNYFYTWGYQAIKDPSKKSEDPNRHVFYINKLEVD